MTEQMETPEYRALVDRYKVKKTTDDCYTPENVYDAVLDFASHEYGFDKARSVRPFFPGGDYERFKYDPDAVVVDNPPFSILAKIIRFYNARGIHYFMFAPTLTCFNAGRDTCNYVITDVTLTYHNGAKIRTSFVTDMGEYAIYSDPKVDEMLTRCEEDNTGRKVRKLIGIDYPADVATTSNISAIVRRGNEYKVRKGEVAYISHVGATRKSIFGGGLLLSVKAAADKAAADSLMSVRLHVELSDEDIEKQKRIGSFADGMRQPEFQFDEGK